MPTDSLLELVFTAGDSLLESVFTAGECANRFTAGVSNLVYSSFCCVPWSYHLLFIFPFLPCSLVLALLDFLKVYHDL